MERKVLALEQATVSDTGVLDGYGAVFGNRDDGGDIIVKGFFAPVLDDFLREGFVSWGHDWDDPIAMPMLAAEDDRGLRLGAKFHSTPRAQEKRTITAERLAEGKSIGLSIGYEIDEFEITEEARRLIKASRLFEVGLVMVPMNREAIVTDVKSAIGAHGSATSDDSWDGPANEARLPNEAAALRAAHAWVDPDGDPDAKATYRFIHHFVSAEGRVGAASLVACSTGIGVLNGGRGGTTIPDGDRRGVYGHLARHLRDGDREVPDLKAIPPAGMSYADHVARVLADVKALEVRSRDLLALREKDGRDLSAANRERIAGVVEALKGLGVTQDELEAVLRSSDPESVAGDVWAMHARAQLALARVEFDFT